MGLVLTSLLVVAASGCGPHVTIAVDDDDEPPRFGVLGGVESGVVGGVVGGVVDGKQGNWIYRAGLYSNDIDLEFGSFDAGIAFSTGIGHISERTSRVWSTSTLAGLSAPLGAGGSSDEGGRRLMTTPWMPDGVSDGCGGLRQSPWTR